MIQPVQVRRALNAVADGVAEVQRLAQPLLGFVLLHHARFGGNGAIDDFLQMRLHIARFKQRKQICVENQPHFDRFGKTIGPMPRRQGFERVKVDQHRARLVERADDVFDAV